MLPSPCTKYSYYFLKNEKIFQIAATILDRKSCCIISFHLKPKLRQFIHSVLEYEPIYMAGDNKNTQTVK